MAQAPWHRPYECDKWQITSSYQGKTFLTRKDKWIARATGYRDGESHARYLGILGSSCGYGSTREEAEAHMRHIICHDIKAYEEYLGVRRFESTVYKANEICPC